MPKFWFLSESQQGKPPLKGSTPVLEQAHKEVDPPKAVLTLRSTHVLAPTPPSGFSVPSSLTHTHLFSDCLTTDGINDNAAGGRAGVTGPAARDRSAVEDAGPRPPERR